MILTDIDGGLSDITNGGSLDDVPDDKLLDRLVLWYAPGAVGATHWLHVATVVLATSSITAFLRLFWEFMFFWGRNSKQNTH